MSRIFDEGTRKMLEFHDELFRIGYLPSEAELDQPGDYRLGLGVVEMLDTFTASGLEIRSVSMPDSGSTLALLALALCGVAGMVQAKTI